MESEISAGRSKLTNLSNFSIILKPNLSIREKLPFFQIFFFLLVLVFWTCALFKFSLSPDYTSGELYDHFLAWFEKGTLYTSIDQFPYRVLNYPPLFLIFTSAMHHLGFSIPSSGKIVTILFFILGAGILYRWFRKAGCEKKPALFLIALLATSFPVFYNIGQWSLQWPAVAFSLFGLYLIQTPTKKANLIFGAFFCAIACFVKQTQVIPILIGFFWLLKYHRKNSVWFALIVTFIGGVGALFLQYYFGEEIWKHLILYTVGSFSFSSLLKQLSLHLLPWIIFFSFGIWLGFKNKEEQKDLRWWYFVGTTFSLLSSARLGASHPYFLEWTIATLLWIGPSIQSSLSSQKNGVGREIRLFSFLLLFQIVAADIGIGVVLFHHVKNLKELEKNIPSLCSNLGTVETIPSGDPGLIRACGKIPALQPFIMTNLSRKKLWDQTPFLNRLSDGQYPLILLPFDLKKEIEGINSERWTDEMISTMRENFQIKTEINEWRIYQWKEK